MSIERQLAEAKLDSFLGHDYHQKFPEVIDKVIEQAKLYKIALGDHYDPKIVETLVIPRFLR